MPSPVQVVLSTRARVKKPHHAPASRDRPREGEPRPRWSMRAAGPARVRRRRVRRPTAGTGLSLCAVGRVRDSNLLLGIATTSYLQYYAVNMYSCS